MLDPFVMNMLRQLAHGVAVQFGRDCEVLIHDLSQVENSICHIENGNVSHRKEGDGPSQIVLEALRHDPATLEDKLCYLTKTHDGRILKSSTMYIRDHSGAVCAIFSINFDITGFLAVDGSIRSLMATDNTQLSSAKSEPQQIPLNVNGLLDELIAQSIQLVGKPVAVMTKEDKVKAIRFLNNSGAFLITKSGDRVTEAFGISKFTLYSYLDAAKES